MTTLRFALALAVAFLLQLVGSAIHPHWPQAVDLFLPAVVLFALGGNSFAALLGGLGAGILQDAMTGGLFGLHGFANTLVGYAVARLAQRLVIQRAAGVFGIGAFASALQQVTLLGLSLLLLPNAHAPEPLWMAVRSAISGLAVAAVVLLSGRLKLAAETHRRSKLSRLRMD